jgi:hypothetical protein
MRALDATLARIAAARANGFGLEVGRRDAAGDGWIDARELVRGPLDAIIADSTRGAGTNLAKVGAEWLLELYAWQGASLVAAATVSEARVPDLSPGNVLVAVEAGRPIGIAVRGGRLTGLSGDPAAAELEVVADEPALAPPMTRSPRISNRSSQRSSRGASARRERCGGPPAIASRRRSCGAPTRSTLRSGRLGSPSG